MKQGTVALNSSEQEHYQNELRTAALVQRSYRLRCRGTRLTPDKLYALCELTWWKGEKVAALWTLWSKSGLPPKDLSGLDSQGFPSDVLTPLHEAIGIVNYYNAYRKSTLNWIRRNFEELAPLLHRAAELKSDIQARELAEAVDKLPKIPKPKEHRGSLSSSSLLTPLFGCLDPRHRFPLVNKAPHVVSLHRRLKITDQALANKFDTLIRLIGQYGIKDALMLDVITWSDQIVRLTQQPVVGIPSPTAHHDRPLDEKDDSDVEIIVKGRSKATVRLHNSMTNALTKLCTQAGHKVAEGTDPYRFDALIKNYDGKGKDLLLEVKSSRERAHLRLAVGQLLDYRRGLPRRAVTDLAVLVPQKPNKESERFLDDVGVYMLWFTDSKRKAVSGNIDVKL